MKQLQMIFMNANGKKTRWIPKNNCEDMTPAEIQKMMEDLVKLGVSNTKGEVLYAKVGQAKYVEVVETPIFEEELTAAPAQAATSKQPVQRTSRPSIKRCLLPSMRQLEIFRPETTARRLVEYVREQGSSLESIDKFLTCLLTAKLVYKNLAAEKSVEIDVYKRNVPLAFELDEWSPRMLELLRSLRDFFDPKQWLQAVRRFQQILRTVLAQILAADLVVPIGFKELEGKVQVLVKEAERSSPPGEESAVALVPVYV